MCALWCLARYKRICVGHANKSAEFSRRSCYINYLFDASYVGQCAPIHTLRIRVVLAHAPECLSLRLQLQEPDHQRAAATLPQDVLLTAPVAPAKSRIGKEGWMERVQEVILWGIYLRGHP